jgi:hypothetical protein
MHYFVMDMAGLTGPQVKLSLNIGANKKNVRLTTYPQARRWSYDFLEVAECLSPLYLDRSLSNIYDFNSVATTDFGNPAFFKLNYAGNIKFYMNVPSEHFLDDQSKSLIYEIRKLKKYVSIRSGTRVQELQKLRAELTAKVQAYL